MFSPPPKKTFISSDAVITERRLYMEEVLQQIAQTPKLACSSLVLEFLGAKRGHKDINHLEVTQSVKVLLYESAYSYKPLHLTLFRIYSTYRHSVPSSMQNICNKLEL